MTDETVDEEVVEEEVVEDDEFVENTSVPVADVSPHVTELVVPQEPGPGYDPSHSAQPGDESGLSMDELVDQVFAGKWGNGQEMRHRLAVAGYDHNEVREAVAARMNPPQPT